MKIKIIELEKELKDKQLRFNVKVDNEKNENSILDDLQFARDNASATIRKEKRKSVFSISACLEKNVDLDHQVNQHQVALKQQKEKKL